MVAMKAALEWKAVQPLATPPNDALPCTARTHPASEASTHGRHTVAERRERSFCFRCTSVLLGSVRTLPRAGLTA
jgi:hypothetical protein